VVDKIASLQKNLKPQFSSLVQSQLTKEIDYCYEINTNLPTLLSEAKNVENWMGLLLS
jgi:hypothetical protein